MKYVVSIIFLFVFLGIPSCITYAVYTAYNDANTFFGEHGRYFIVKEIREIVTEQPNYTRKYREITFVSLKDGFRIKFVASDGQWYRLFKYVAPEQIWEMSWTSAYGAALIQPYDLIDIGLKYE